MSGGAIRVKADQSVAMSTLMEALSTFMARRGTRDLWALVKVMDLTWKSGPQYASLFLIVPWLQCVANIVKFLWSWDTCGLLFCFAESLSVSSEMRRYLVRLRICDRK